MTVVPLRRPQAREPEPAAAPSEARPGKGHHRRRRFAWIGTAASVVLFVTSLGVLWHIASDIQPGEVTAAFTAATARQIGLAVLLTAASYVLLTGYDGLALRQLGVRVPFRTTAFASFTSYAVSFTLGFPLLTGGTVRYWIYAPRGVTAGRIASITVIAGLTFWLGMGAVLGWSLIRKASELYVLVWTHEHMNHTLGVLACVIVGAYLAWVGLKRRSVRIQGWRLELPGFRLSLAQIVLGAGDVCAAAAVLFVLLPQGHGIDYETFLAVYVVATMLGIASHSPGGLGVFEATILLALSRLPREPVLGALLLFRICYYLLPFILALALLGMYEIAGRLRATRRELQPEED
jgi:uncharacterized membrane protein YbhN (UPF0104 family)